jgi:hypothetical protein
LKLNFQHKNCWGQLLICTSNFSSILWLVFKQSQKQNRREELYSFNVVFLSVIFSFPSGTAFQRVQKLHPTQLILNTPPPKGKHNQPSKEKHKAKWVQSKKKNLTIVFLEMRIFFR